MIVPVTTGVTEAVPRRTLDGRMILELIPEIVKRHNAELMLHFVDPEADVDPPIAYVTGCRIGDDDRFVLTACYKHANTNQIVGPVVRWMRPMGDISVSVHKGGQGLELTCPNGLPVVLYGSY